MKSPSFFKKIKKAVYIHKTIFLFKEEIAMETICVQNRDLTVKAKKLRKLGMIPASIFGRSLPESISIQMDEPIARRLFFQNREGSKFLIDLEGKVFLVQIKEKTMNTINNEIQQISFQVLVADEKVNSVIHIFLENDEKISGQLERGLLEIPYSSLPGDMIDKVIVDLDGMKIGTIITIKDVPEIANSKVELHVDKDEMVFRISEMKNRALELGEE